MPDVNEHDSLTYANSREDILKLVDQRNQARVINIYAAHELARALSDVAVGDRGWGGCARVASRACHGWRRYEELRRMNESVFFKNEIKIREK